MALIAIRDLSYSSRCPPEKAGILLIVNCDLVTKKIDQGGKRPNNIYTVVKLVLIGFRELNMLAVRCRNASTTASPDRYHAVRIERPKVTRDELCGTTRGVEDMRCPVCPLIYW